MNKRHKQKPAEPLSCMQILAVCAMSLCFHPSSLGAGEQQPQSYDELTRAGEIAFSKNNYAQAEKYFAGALREAERWGTKDMRIATACKNLASYYEVRGQFSKAEAFLERELRVKEKALGAEHPKVIQSVGKLIRFYQARDNWPKADRLTGLLTAYCERVLKDQQTVDAHYDGLSNYYAAHPEYAEAQKHLAKVREVSGKVRADDYLELAAILDDIASACKDKRRFDQAEQLYKKALTLREKTLSPTHQALAFSYEHLAALYQARNKPDLARPLFKQALEISGKSMQLDRPESYGRLDALARSCITAGEPQQAESLYKQAISVLRELQPPRRREIGLASAALAQLATGRGSYVEARDYFKTALSIAEGAHGPQSAALLPILEPYADVLEKCGSQTEALRIRNRANAIKGAATACKPPERASDDF